MVAENTTMKRVLVTGATGFIGRHLCNYLQQQGVYVRALSRHPASGPWDDQAISILGEDKLSAELLRDIDTVIHLAGHAHAVDEIGGADTHQKVTVAGTRDLLALIGQSVERLLFVSSVKAIPVSPSCEPDSDYGKAKRDAEELVQDLHRRLELRTIVLRLPLVYGPGVKGNLQRMLKAIARRRFPPIPEFGNRRSMIHVEDVCVAIVKALQHGTSGASYTLTDGQVYSSRDIYLAMCSALRQPAPRWSIPVIIFKLMAHIGDVLGAVAGRRLGFDSDALDKLAGDALYDNSAAVTDFQFQPRYCLVSALPEMLASRGGGNRQWEH